MHKVFLVDGDERLLSEIIQTINWRNHGFEVIGAVSDARKALEEVKCIKPEVIFCDLKLPEMDGHTFIAAVKEEGIDAEFVMLSAYGTFEDARTFFRLGGFDYILKPHQIEEVQSVLEKLAGKLKKKSPSTLGRENESTNAAFVELVQYLNENFKEKFTLTRLSRQFGLNSGYICNLFVKHYKSTLTRFLTELRMKAAGDMIKSKDKNLKVIALECGYTDYYYFNKVFKKYYGVAPSRYIG